MRDLSASAIAFARSRHDEYLEQLGEWIAIPSISILPEYDPETVKAGEWMAERLKALNPDRVELFPTPRYPVVFADLPSKDPDLPTVMIYGHYDVMSVDPVSEWESDPFEAVVKDHYLYGRGASDMKGQVMACLAAVEALQSVGDLPVNLKFLIEGEEESAPSHLDQVLAEHSKLFACDVCLNPDAGMAGPETPSIIYGVRGHMTGRLHIQGPSHDVHSGSYGGMIDNPLHVVSRVIAGLHDDRNRVTIYGFYDDVAEISKAERARLAELPHTEAELQKRTGVPKFWGEAGFSAFERATVRPSLDVILIEGGAMKSAVPSRAMAVIAIRLAPHQDPDKIFEGLERYLEDCLPDTVNWEFERRGKCTAVLMNVDSPWIEAMRSAQEMVWGKPPILERLGGSLPAASDFKDELGVESILFGFGLPGDNIHGPNERLHLPTWKRGIEALIQFFHLVAEAEAR
jgi:acetylornithine deacetylase/succinyl-diaminopimelate desuccinylase-like protein